MHTPMTSTTFAGQPAQRIECPTCGSINAHITGKPTVVEGYESQAKGGTKAPFRQSAVRVPAQCEAKKHDLFVYVSEHKGEVHVWVDVQDWGA